MSTPDSSPPAQPPMMSPDGKWVWDGQKWIPVAVHESVFPAYNEAAAAAVNAQPGAPLAETMVSPPINPFATAAPTTAAPATPFPGPPGTSPFVGPPSASPFDHSVAAPAVVSPPIVQPLTYTAKGATPPWQAWAGGGSGRSRTMYLVGAFIAVALGVILVIYFTMSQLPFLRASDGGNTPNPTPVASPTPQLAVRSDQAVAQRYVDNTFGNATGAIGHPLLQMLQACNGTLSASCQEAVTAMDAAVTTALNGLTEQPPQCIARQVAKVKADIAGLQVGVKAALKAYTDNNRQELQQALAKFKAANNGLQPDIHAVVTAAAACDGQPSGP